VDVPIEDADRWTRIDLAPVRIGRIVVFPGPAAAPDDASDLISLVIPPSMGFGTGHHASTRLCLDLLQQLPMNGMRVLDIGTGSGILALAASRLGAASVVGIDEDEHAVQAARENLARDDAPGRVELRVEEFPGTAAPLSDDKDFDVVFANLTDEALIRSANAVSKLLARGGHVIASGFLSDQDTRVVEAFQRAGLEVVRRATEDGWVAAMFTPSPTPSRSR
jgi:ribosomal protein L11 methyltransferase